MKKILLVFCSAISILNPSLGQPVLDLKQCFGSTGIEKAYSITQTKDDGYIIAGEANHNGGDVSGNHGLTDCWILKLDVIGRIQWQKSLGGSDPDLAEDIIQTSDGGYIIAGSTYSNDSNVSGNHGICDAWIVKLDIAGNLQWQKCYGGSDIDWVREIIQTSDGGYVVAGFSESVDGDLPFNFGSGDYWIFKIDSSGIMQWQQLYGGGDGDILYEMIQTTDGGYAVVGGSFQLGNGNHGLTDYWILKLDSTGVMQWQKMLGGSETDVGYSIFQTNDGGYVVAGASVSDDGDVSGHHGPLGNNYADCWIVKLDFNGNIQWQKSLGGSYSDAANSIIQSFDGNYVFAGNSQSNDGDVSGHHGNTSLSDYWVAKIDHNGNIIWNYSLGGNNDEDANCLIQNNEGNLVIAGATLSNDGDVTGNHGSWDQWMLISEEFNYIKGLVFVDFNMNQVFDANEMAITNHIITETNTSRSAFSFQDGIYYLPVQDSGNYEVTPALINYYNPIPLTHSIYFSSIHQTDSLNDFAFQPTGVFNDLCITITPMGNFRAGFNAGYMLNYENVGTTTLNATVIFFPDNDVTFVSSNPVATSVTTDSVVWNVGTLTPFQTGSILVTVNVNAGTPIGTLINSNARIEPVTGDNYPGCNYAYWEVYTTGAVDPNAILVDRDTVLTTELSSPPYLNYIIYFQNTGNDTAFNARVLNNIPQTLDVNSFEFVASSHPMNITYGAHARLMTFTFDNIFLPDSNVNEPASHGFIRYKIKPKSTLVAGDLINNTAFIYFDFNSSVQTNTAVTEIVLPTGEESFGFEVSDLWLYPNPVKDELIVSSNKLKEKGTIRIFDLFGREVFQLQTSNLKPQTKINVSDFSQGVYIIEMRAGEQVLRGKFLKE